MGIRARDLLKIASARIVPGTKIYWRNLWLKKTNHIDRPVRVLARTHRTNLRAAKYTHVKRPKTCEALPKPSRANTAIKPSRFGMMLAVKQRELGPTREAALKVRGMMLARAREPSRMMPNNMFGKTRPGRFSLRLALDSSLD